MEDNWSGALICDILILETAGQTLFPFSFSFGMSVQVDVSAMVLDFKRKDYTGRLLEAVLH